jgi:hypothetical protein
MQVVFLIGYRQTFICDRAYWMNTNRLLPLCKIKDINNKLYINEQCNISI